MEIILNCDVCVICDALIMMMMMYKNDPLELCDKIA